MVKRKREKKERKLVYHLVEYVDEKSLRFSILLKTVKWFVRCEWRFVTNLNNKQKKQLE